MGKVVESKYKKHGSLKDMIKGCMRVRDYL